MYSTTKSNLLPSTRLYWLNNACIEIPDEIRKKLDKHYNSKQSVNELSKEYLKYRYYDSTTKKYYFDEIKVFADLTNGINNWYGSPSRLDALYKVITNSEAGMDAKNINLDFSGKFMVAGQTSLDNPLETPLTKQEQRSIEDVATSSKQVHAVKSMIDIKRFVENIANLRLDESFQADFMTIGSMYGIPKELLDATTEGSTYENQEKAIGRHVSYALQPKADDLANGLEQWFGFDNSDINITLSFDHLPFMQVFEKDRAEVNKSKAETFKVLIESGVTRDSAAAMLDMEVEFENIESPNG